MKFLIFCLIFNAVFLFICAIVKYPFEVFLFVLGLIAIAIVVGVIAKKIIVLLKLQLMRVLNGMKVK